MNRPLRFINNYVYAPHDNSTCLCFWKQEDRGEFSREDYVELFRINKYCRIHGTSPKIQDVEKKDEQ